MEMEMEVNVGRYQVDMMRRLVSLLTCPPSLVWQIFFKSLLRRYLLLPKLSMYDTDIMQIILRSKPLRHRLPVVALTLVLGRYYYQGK